MASVQETTVPHGSSEESGAERRRRALVALRLALLGTEYAAQGSGFRSVKFSGLFMAVSAVLAVLLATAVGAGDVSDLLALRLLAYAAWAYGLMGLPALMRPELSRVTGSRLARLRGHELSIPPLRGLGLALRLFQGLLVAALPGILVSAVVSESLRTFAGRGLLVLLAATYLALLAITLGLVGAISEKLAPERPRLVAALIVLLPFVLSFFFDGVPSIPGIFVWFFGGLVDWGGIV